MDGDVIETQGNTQVYLQTGQAAKVLDVHPNTLRRWAELGLIPYIRYPNGCRRFWLPDLHEFLAERKQRDNVS